jgi:hypothetical protein
MGTTKQFTTLSRAIRDRMSSHDDAELLRIWVENDRFHYSGDAFEAVRSLLVERGIDPPPQDPPPPMAVRLPAGGTDADTAYGLSWLRPVLLFGVVLALLRLVGAGGGLYMFLNEYPGPPSDWLAASAFRYSVVSLLTAGWFLATAWLAVRLRPWGRVALMIYCWASLLAALSLVGAYAYAVVARGAFRGWGFQYVSELVHGSAYPLLLLLLLRRTEIKALFEPRPAGFEVHTSAR